MSRRFMRPLLSLSMTAALLALCSTTARAQFAVPFQPPKIEPAGSFILYPSIGVIHDPDFSNVALMLRGRYSVLDQLSVSAQLGGTFGDANDFQFGFGGKFLLLDQNDRSPVQVATFGAFDVGVGDLDSESLAFGPLVGHRFDVENLGLTPYGGFSVGFTHSSQEAGNQSESNTDVLFGFILGGDIAFSRDLSSTMEFTIGATDGIPILNWHFGVSYALLSAPRYVPPTSTPL
jgi:hypothetical protein